VSSVVFFFFFLGATFKAFDDALESIDEISSLSIQIKPNFIRNQPHQSRKRERGKVIVKSEA
jgi:hypothetical protein